MLITDPATTETARTMRIRAKQPKQPSFMGVLGQSASPSFALGRPRRSRYTNVPWAKLASGLAWLPDWPDTGSRPHPRPPWGDRSTQPLELSKPLFFNAF